MLSWENQCLIIHIPFYFNLKLSKDVTPKNFLNILKGDKEAMKGIGSGKVIDRYVKFSWNSSKWNV